MPDPIYLDYNATTPVAPDVADAISHALRDLFGNPSSRHPVGRRAAAAMARARAQVAQLIGADPGEILFTGSATEADNLAVLGVAHAAPPDRRHLVTSAIEHPAIAAPMRQLEQSGWELSVLQVDRHGLVSVADLEAAIRPNTALVSVMLANNEIGTIQPVAELAAITRSRGIPFHTDAAQAVGKIPVDVEELGVDLLTIAGHKFGAPKGIGALYLRQGTRLEPMMYGGGQERGIRPGTENIPYIVGLGAAAELARNTIDTSQPEIRRRRDLLHRLLAEEVPGLALNGHPQQRLPNTLHLSFPGVSGAELLATTPEIAASVGSACHSEDTAVSGVLGAMELDAEAARGAVRLSLGRATSDEEIGVAAEALAAAWRQLVRSRGIS
jgi:cysteine desulfurase